MLAMDINTTTTLTRGYDTINYCFTLLGDILILKCHIILLTLDSYIWIRQYLILCYTCNTFISPTLLECSVKLFFFLAHSFSQLFNAMLMYEHTKNSIINFSVICKFLSQVKSNGLWIFQIGWHLGGSLNLFFASL